MNFRKCGHPEISEECQSCRHDAAVEQLCTAQTELKAALLQISERERQTDEWRKAAYEERKEKDAKIQELDRLYSELQNAVRNLLKAPHNSFNDAMWREKVKGLLTPEVKRYDAKGHPIESEAEKIDLWEFKVKDLTSAIQAVLIDGHVSERGSKVLQASLDRTPQESKEFLR